MAENYTLQDWKDGKFRLETYVDGGIRFETLKPKVQANIRKEQNRIAELIISNGLEERKAMFIKQYNTAHGTIKRKILKNELAELDYGLFGNQTGINEILILSERKVLYKFGNRSVSAAPNFFEQVHTYISTTYVNHLRNDYKFDFIEPAHNSNFDSLELHPILCGEILWRYRMWLYDEYVKGGHKKPQGEVRTESISSGTIQQPLDTLQVAHGFFIGRGNEIFNLCWERHSGEKDSFRFFSELYFLLKKDDYIFKQLTKADYLRHLQRLNDTWSNKRLLSHHAIANRPQEKAMKRYSEVLKKLNLEKKT